MRHLVAFFSVLFFLLSLFALLCPFITPEIHWIFSLIALSIPILMVLNFILLVIFAIIKSKRIFFPLIVLVLFGIMYLPSVINFSAFSDSKNSFSLLSYNVNGFSRPDGYYRDRTWRGDKVLQQSRDLIDFVSHSDADIICLQEYYNDSLSIRYNTRDVISDSGKYFFAGSTKRLRINKAQFGVMIFSKFPLIHSEEIPFPTKNAQNRGVYVDVDLGNDTIRIINVHLESNEGRLSEWRKFLSKWKNSQEKLALQLEQVNRFIDSSPYPVLIAGDFNSTPFSYVYVNLKSRLANSFESKGTGIGATYNHQIIKVIRIDHQFFSSEIKCVSFNTLNNVNFSDHFPLLATYSLVK